VIGGPGGMAAPIALAVAALAVVASGACARPPPEPARPEPPAGALAPVSVALRADADPAGHAVVVDNHTDRAFSLRSLVIVEVLERGWRRIPAESVYLRPSCPPDGAAPADPPRCVEVAPHSTLRAAPWTHSVGDAQCACDGCRPAGPGRYRFVVETCDANARLESEPFDL
jgi:hypothetical protein